MEQFQSALEALPGGVIFMDDHRILWMNALAADMMGLLPTQDKGMPIEHLVREPDFVASDERLGHAHERERDVDVAGDELVARRRR